MKSEPYELVDVVAVFDVEAARAAVRGLFAALRLEQHNDDFMPMLRAIAVLKLALGGDDE